MFMVGLHRGLLLPSLAVAVVVLGRIKGLGPKAAADDTIKLHNTADVNFMIDNKMMSNDAVVRYIPRMGRGVIEGGTGSN